MSIERFNPQGMMRERAERNQQQGKPVMDTGPDGNAGKKVEGERMLLMDDIAKRSNMTFGDLKTLKHESKIVGKNRMTSITGSVDGVKVDVSRVTNLETNEWKYEGTVDGKLMNRRDSEQVFSHLGRVLKERDAVNDDAVEETVAEIETEAETAPLVNRILGKKAGEKPRESSAA